MKRRYYLFLLFGLAVATLIACTTTKRDVPFNVNTAYQKEIKHFPFITVPGDETAPNVSVDRDVVYITRETKKGKNRAMHLDVFYLSGRPAEKSKPAVVMIHGGGWASGTKYNLHPMANYLAKEGIVSVPVEYRLSGEAQYPAAIHDVNAAIRWLKSHAQQYGADPDKIAVLGTSAGAQMATLIGTTGRSDILDDTQSAALFPGIDRSVHAIINIDGVVDFTTPEALKHENKRKERSAAGRWFGGAYEDKPELWQQASPVYHVDRFTPPTLFINSSIPRFHSGRDEYIEKLNEYGIYNEVFTHDKTPHPFWLFNPWFEPTADLVKTFILKVLTDKAPSQ